MDWLRRIVNNEACWDGDTLVFEMRYFGGVAEAAIAAKFTFERDARPN